MVGAKRVKAHMLTWLKTRILGGAEAALAGTVRDECGLGMARPYAALYEYLHGRYGDAVQMSFAEIEDVLGFTLPVSAKRDARWWANDDPRNAAHANSWLLARRSARPNIVARSVSFERGYKPDGGRE